MSNDHEQDWLITVQGLVNKASSPMVLTDRDGKIMALSDKIMDISAWERSALVGEALIGSLIQSKQSFDQFISSIKKKLRQKWIDAHGQMHEAHIKCIKTPFQDELFQGGYGYLIVFEKLLGSTLQEEQLQLLFAKQLFSHSHLGFLLCNVEGKIIQITEDAAKILGGTRQEFLQQNLLQLLEPLPEDRKLVQSTFFSGVHIRNKAMQWDNGTMQYELLIDSFPIKDEEQQIVGVSVMIKDVTNVRSLENQLRRNDRLAMIGQIAAGTAHEIRNPLTAVKGFLQVLKTTLNEKGYKKEVTHTEIMLQEIERINYLVGELLLLSKSREARFNKLDIHDLMEQYIPLLQNEALLKGINLEYIQREHLPHVIGNSELLKQVFLNISKNAIEAMTGSKGLLKIFCHVNEHEKMISINFEDNGPGIPPYVLDKIFDPFFTTKEEGTGLGLSVCQRIVHDMGGKITVSSKGYGTTFHIHLPYQED